MARSRVLWRSPGNHGIPKELSKRPLIGVSFPSLVPSEGKLAHRQECTAIEQNRAVWGQFAREFRQLVQFKRNATDRFVAVAVDGEVKEYH